MMEILTAKQIYEIDQATIKNQDISSLDLMERAGTVCFNWIHTRLQGNPIKVHVFCGIGNNGGDGLVIARHLHQYGYNVDCYVVNFSEKRSEGFLANYDRLKDVGVWPKVINSVNDFPEISPKDIVVDAILGIGLSRKIKGFTTKLIKYINEVQAYTLAIDIPSGLYSDKCVTQDCAVIEASHTLTFQRPKLAFLLPQNESFIYTWEIIDIGLDENYIAQMNINNFTIDKHDVLTIYKSRDKFTHKGTYGHSLIIGGSYGKIGSVVLASKGALKAGSGLVTAYIPKCGYDIVQISIPEAMVEVDSDKEIEFFNYKTKPTVIGIGVGLGTSEKTKKGFSKFLEINKSPLVIDADALNIISQNKELLKLIPKNSVLTPHPKEFERLVGKWDDDFEKLDKLKSFSSENNVIIVLKGANTAIAVGEKLYFNTSGNSALSTAGTGDILTGIITGLISQGYDTVQASILGVYLHGVTANLAMKDMNMSVESFTASTVLENLGKAFLSLFIDDKLKPTKEDDKKQEEPKGKEDDYV